MTHQTTTTTKRIAAANSHAALCAIEGAISTDAEQEIWHARWLSINNDFDRDRQIEEATEFRRQARLCYGVEK